MDFPIWFIMFIGLFLLSILSGITNRLLTTKNSQKFISLKTETKMKLVKSAIAQIKIFKFYFWMLPLNLIIVPVLIYMYAPTGYLLQIIIMLILSYIGALQVFWNKKNLIILLSQDGKESQ